MQSQLACVQAAAFDTALQGSASRPALSAAEKLINGKLLSANLCLFCMLLELAEILHHNHLEDMLMSSAGCWIWLEPLYQAPPNIKKQHLCPFVGILGFCMLPQCHQTLALHPSLPAQQPWRGLIILCPQLLNSPRTLTLPPWQILGVQEDCPGPCLLQQPGTLCQMDMA